MVAGCAALPGDRRTAEMSGGRAVKAKQSAAWESRSGSPLEVFRVFLKLGVSSSAGRSPISAISAKSSSSAGAGSTKQAFVDLVALCQFLPGPASSQVGFSIGLMRAGYAGAARGMGRLHAAVGDHPCPLRLWRRRASRSCGGGPAPRSQARRRRHRRAGRLGNGAHAMSGSERASIAVVSALIILFSTSSDSADRGDRSWRHFGPLALPRCAAERRRARSPCRYRAASASRR